MMAPEEKKVSRGNAAGKVDEKLKEAEKAFRRLMRLKGKLKAGFQKIMAKGRGDA